MCCVSHLLLFVSAQLLLKCQLLAFTLQLADLCCKLRCACALLLEVMLHRGHFFSLSVEVFLGTLRSAITLVKLTHVTSVNTFVCTEICV